MWGGSVEYSLIAEGTDRELLPLQRQIGDVMHLPLVFSLPYTGTGEGALQALCGVIKGLLYLETGAPIASVQYSLRSDLETVEFRPTLSLTLQVDADDSFAYSSAMQGERNRPYTQALELALEPVANENSSTSPFYLGEEETMALKQLLPLDEYWGYIVPIGSSAPAQQMADPLLWLALGNSTYEGLASQVVNKGGLPLLSVREDISPETQTEYRAFASSLEGSLIALRDKGVYAVCHHQIALLQELAFSYSLEVLSPRLQLPQPSCLYVRDSSSYALNKEWMMEALRSLNRGSLPLVTVGGDWMLQASITPESIVKTQYYAWRAYIDSQLGDSAELLWYIESVWVSSDLSCLVPCTQLQGVQNFQSLLSNYLSRPCSHRLYSRYSDAVAARIEAQYLLPDRIWLVISRGDTHYLVGDTEQIPPLSNEDGEEFPIDLYSRGVYSYGESAGILQDRPPLPKLNVPGDIEIEAGTVWVQWGEKRRPVLTLASSSLGKVGEEELSRLWREGFFLGPWGRHWYRLSGEWSSLPTEAEMP
jgi:hypothetical protein